MVKKVTIYPLELIKTHSHFKMFTCEFCGYETPNRRALYNHKKRTKYCSGETQSSSPTPPLNQTVKDFEEYKARTEAELFECKAELDECKKLLLDYEKRLAISESKLESSAQVQDFMKELTLKTLDKSAPQKAKSKVDHLLPLTDDYITSCAQYFTEEYTTNGPVGYAKFALEYPFKNRVICTNKQAKYLRYKDKSGVEKSDSNHIITVFIDSIRQKNLDILTPVIDKLIDELNYLEGSDITSASERLCILGEQQYLKEKIVENIHRHICNLLM